MVKLSPPLAGELVITQRFRENPDDYAEFGLAGHPGVDLRAKIGTPVLASHDGVADPRWGPINGDHVYIFGEGLHTLYSHLSESSVGKLERARAGQQIGLSGNSGRSTGPHLHWGLKIDGVKNPGYKDWLDPIQYLARGEDMRPRIGWHLGNEEPISDVDWAIMQLVPPEVVTFLPGERITLDDGRRILELQPDCHFILRPYLDPNRLGDKENPNYAGVLPQYFDECKRALDDWSHVVPEGQRHLQMFNEQNMPRWSQWEGFGPRRSDMDAFNTWFITGLADVGETHPDWQLGWTPLTPGNRDTWFESDPTNEDYYMHSAPNSLDPEGPCDDSLGFADEYYAHIYLHEFPPDTPYGGLRFAEYAKRFSKDTPIWITEAGYPSVDKWVSDERLLAWLNLLCMYNAQNPNRPVAGVTFWKLGRREPWGPIWYDGGQPRRAVHMLKEWREQQAIVIPPQPTPETPSDEDVRNLAWNSLGVSYTMEYAFPQYARRHALGAPLKEGWETRGMAIQPFAQGIVVCRVGYWDEVTHLSY